MFESKDYRDINIHVEKSHRTEGVCLYSKIMFDVP
jgi:hypothetical protein